MNQEQINELHSIIKTHCRNKGYKPAELLTFLSVTFIGTMAMYGFSQDFFDKTCDLMKLKYKLYKKDGS